jgi:hypothetical protein
MQFYLRFQVDSPNKRKEKNDIITGVKLKTLISEIGNGSELVFTTMVYEPFAACR